MCDQYSMTKDRSEVAALVKALSDRNHNRPLISGDFPDYASPVVVVTPVGAREMRDMHWGMPSPF